MFYETKLKISFKNYNLILDILLLSVVKCASNKNEGFKILNSIIKGYYVAFATNEGFYEVKTQKTANTT